MSQEGKSYPATAAHPSLGEAAAAGHRFTAEFALGFRSFLIIEVRLLGLLYYANRKRLGWFSA